MADDLPWARGTEHGWRLALRVHPRARRSEVLGEHAAELRIRIAAPANDGKANAELTRFVADRLGVARRDVTLVRGATSRSKVLGVPADADPRRLLP